MTYKRKTANRRGSALLVCTLAATVLSMAAIAILRSSQRNISRVDALRGSCQGRSVSEGLLQRSIAIIRNDPAASGLVNDPGVALPGARSQLTRLSPSATRIQVFLYAGASTPAIDTVVNPRSLANPGGGSGPGGGGGRGPGGTGPPGNPGGNGRGPGGTGPPGRGR